MASNTQTHSFHHPRLGFLKGRLSTSQIAHFRSIPFARIPGRFRQSTVITAFDEAECRDFTAYGAVCPQSGHTEVDAMGGPLLQQPQAEIKYDESSCLNLTIAAPVNVLGGGKDLIPVMVYVHGGAFKEGMGNISPLHDSSNLVNMSINEGQPVVIVNIHYRVNWFGFLACQDLIDEASANSEIPCNFGLQDQRNAFLWIKEHISGFGGDPSRITAFGESAGSAGIAMLMCSDVPVFNRAILQSGSPATGPAVELKYKEAEYRALLKFVGIDERDPNRLEKLRNIPVDRLVDGINGVGIAIFSALRDEQFFPRGSPNWWTQDDIIGSCEWVDEVIIGDCFFEGFLMADVFRPIPLDGFISLTRNTLGEANAKNILDSYDIVPGMDANRFWTKLMYLMGDICFSEPSHKLVTKLASVSKEATYHKKVYRYTVTVRNPFPGSPHYQVPGHHFVEILFLFGTLQSRYTMQRDRDLSIGLMKRWLRFGAGLEPWDPYVIDGTEEEGKIMVVNGVNGFDLRSKKEDEQKSQLSEEGKRRYENWEIIAEVMNDIGSRDMKNGVNARLAWGTDGGVFQWVLPPGSPTGVVLP